MSTIDFADDNFDNPSMKIRTRSWIVLLALVIASGGSLYWSFTAKIPVTVQSQGILMHPTGVTNVEAKYFGSIRSVLVSRGQAVVEGDVLVELSLPDLNSDIRKAEATLQSKIELHQKANQIEEKRLQDENELADRQCISMQTAIDSIQQLIRKNKEINEKNIAQQKGEIQKISVQSQKMFSQLNEERQKKKLLVDRKLATHSELTSLDNRILDSTRQQSALEDRKNALELQRLNNQQILAELETKKMDLALSITETKNKIHRLKLKIAGEVFRRNSDIETGKAVLNDLQNQYNDFRLVKATSSGTVIELPATVGESVRAGEVLGTIAKCPAPGEPNPLRVTAFFPLNLGKQVEIGDEAFVTPTTVQRERYGSILGNVKDVYSLPVSAEEAVHIVGNRQVLKPLLNQGGLLGIHADLNRNADGSLEWSSNNSPPHVLPFISRTVFGVENVKAAKK